MIKYTILLIAICFLSLTGCDAGPDSPKGFSLPKGNLENGKLVFVKHECLACHVLKGVSAGAIKPELDKLVALGGEKSKVTTYAELVTSIINPSHKISGNHKLNSVAESGQSKMRNYNDVMTVTELIDLVTYLQAQYKVKPYEYTSYGHYYQTMR